MTPPTPVLPGMTAAFTILPVFGVPCPSRALNGQDSLLSIVQMPAGVPVMIAWGTRDRLLFLGQARVAKAHLPEALLVPLPGCGHVPMTDDPPLVADVLLRGSGRA